MHNYATHRWKWAPHSQTAHAIPSWSDLYHVRLGVGWGWYSTSIFCKAICQWDSWKKWCHRSVFVYVHTKMWYTFTICLSLSASDIWIAICLNDLLIRLNGSFFCSNHLLISLNESCFSEWILFVRTIYLFVATKKFFIYLVSLSCRKYIGVTAEEVLWTALTPTDIP